MAQEQERRRAKKKKLITDDFIIFSAAFGFKYAVKRSAFNRFSVMLNREILSNVAVKLIEFICPQIHYS